MSHTLSERTIAFAGICQAASLVQAVAKNGECDEAAFKASIQSITQTNPDSTLAVFGQLDDLKIGLQAIINGINTNGNQDLTKYTISILALERKLNANSNAMNSLGDRIDTINRQLEHYDLMDTQMLSNVASIYLDVVSPIGPRIQVAGSQTVLQQPTNQHKVRALLLAGIRSAVLWRQVGGKHRQLVLSRKAMVAEATNLLARI